LIAIRKDTEMQNYYRNIKVKRKSVIIKVAHKMARRISVIKTETPYQINRNLVPIAIDSNKITFLTSSTIQENRLQNHGGSIK
jgi:hypothetical protein